MTIFITTGSGNAGTHTERAVKVEVMEGNEEIFLSSSFIHICQKCKKEEAKIYIFWSSLLHPKCFLFADYEKPKEKKMNFCFSKKLNIKR
jgi:hypothetical protein